MNLRHQVKELILKEIIIYQLSRILIRVSTNSNIQIFNNLTKCYNRK